MDTKLTKKELKEEFKKAQKRKVLKRNLLWRWPVFTFLLTAIIIGIIAFSQRSWNVAQESGIFIFWSEKPTFQLPFSISRWWDVLWGPIMSIVTIHICFSMETDPFASSSFLDDFCKAAFLIVFWFGSSMTLIDHTAASSLFTGTVCGLVAVALIVFLVNLIQYVLAPLCYWLSGNHNLQ